MLNGSDGPWPCAPEKGDPGYQTHRVLLFLVLLCLAGMVGGLALGFVTEVRP